MNQITKLITNTIGFIRDIFIYLIPSTPFVLLMTYYFSNQVKQIIKQFSDYSNPTIAAIIAVLVIFIIGRFLHILSFYLFELFDLLFNWIPLSINKERKRIIKLNKEFIKNSTIKSNLKIELNQDELELYEELKIFTTDPNIYQVYLERYTLMLNYNRTMSSGFFIISIALILFRLQTISILFPLLFFLLSILFYFEWISAANIYDSNSLISALFIDNNLSKYKHESFNTNKNMD